MLKYQKSTQTSQNANSYIMALIRPHAVRICFICLVTMVETRHSYLSLKKYNVVLSVLYIAKNFWSLASVILTQTTSALGWETLVLETRRQKARLCMLFKTINGIIKSKSHACDHYKPHWNSYNHIYHYRGLLSHDTNLSLLSPTTNRYTNIPFPRDTDPPLELAICLHSGPSHPHICTLLEQL